jgi:RNA polymerase sigma-70 factor (ECF subfamily)
MNIEAEFSQIYDTHAPKVFRLCLGYASGDEALAKDWQEETFIKVWNHRNSFKAESSISTWIYRIAINTCLGDLRKPKKAIRLNEEAMNTNESDVDNSKTELQLKKMYECVGKLTPINKAIVLLELEDIPQATIAEMQGMAHGALRTRLNRIKKSLLKCITNGE